MNIFSLLISAGFNLIQAPFADDSLTRSNLRNSIAENRENNESSQIGFPFNILRNSPACETILFKMGENTLKLTALPRGPCPNCCPAKMHRDVSFVLYNKARPRKGVPIVPFLTAGAARKAGADPGVPTVIFVHGFSEPSPGESGRRIVDAYLSRPEKFNIILLNWSEMCTFPWYTTAVSNVKYVGNILANFIQTFHTSGEIPIGNLHIVGFSLGSHVAAVAGKRLKNGLRIPRITALDPAYPEFSLRDTSRRLDNKDAEYIDVIHTDGGVFGFPLALGHADFFPNGGRALQPGCQPSYLVQVRVADQVVACSHVRAWRLYAESVQNPEAFPATGCKIWRGPDKQCNFTVDAYMGFGNDKFNPTYIYFYKEFAFLVWNIAQMLARRHIPLPVHYAFQPIWVSSDGRRLKLPFQAIINKKYMINRNNYSEGRHHYRY